MTLTPKNLSQLAQVIKLEINNAFKERLDWKTLRKAIRLEMDEALEDKLTEKLGRYPTKDEFYEANDKLMKELESMREEITLVPARNEVDELKGKISFLENKFAIV